MVLVAACGGSAPPPRDATWVQSKVLSDLERNREWLDALMMAADVADQVYNEIADTPIKDIEARAEELGAKITRARDGLRRARSYGFLPRASGYDTDEFYQLDRDIKTLEQCSRRSPTGNCNIQGVTLKDRRLKLNINVVQGTGASSRAQVWILSSRQKPIMCITCVSGRNDVMVMPDFHPILEGDSISIPDITARIKR